MTSPIDDYRRQLRASLRTPPEETGRILAEAEDHLRESLAAGRTAGLTETEAQQAAISAFGSVNAVVRAHERRGGAVALAGNLVLAAWKLAGLFLLAVGASGLLDLIMDRTAGQLFVFAGVPVAHPTAAECRYWLSEFPGVHGCAQASMLDDSHDRVSLLVAAGVLGVLLFGLYLVVRYLQGLYGWPAPEALPRGFFPVIAACCFGLWAVGLAVGAATTGSGPGSFISLAIVTAALAAAYVLRLRRARLPDN